MDRPGKKPRMALAIALTGITTILPAKSDPMPMTQNMPGMDMGQPKPGGMPMNQTMPGMDMGPAKTGGTGMRAMDMSKPGQMDMSKPGNMAMHGDFGPYSMNRDSSGTSWQPDLAPAMGRMTMIDGWMLMTDLRLTGVADNQSGPRGGSDAFAEGMAMAMVSRDLGGGTL